MEQTLPPTEDQSELIARLTRENEALRKENERLRGLKYATSGDIDREIQKLQGQRIDILNDRVTNLASIVLEQMTPKAVVHRTFSDPTTELMGKGTALGAGSVPPGQDPCIAPVVGSKGGAL